MAWIELSGHEYHYFYDRPKINELFHDSMLLHDYVNTEGIYKISTYEAVDKDAKDGKLFVLLIDAHGFV